MFVVFVYFIGIWVFCDLEVVGWSRWGLGVVVFFLLGIRGFVVNFIGWRINGNLVKRLEF